MLDPGRKFGWLMPQNKLAQGFLRNFDAIEGMAKYLKEKHIDFRLMIRPSQCSITNERFRPGAARLFERDVAEAGRRGIPNLPMRQAFADQGGNRFVDFYTRIPKVTASSRRRWQSIPILLRFETFRSFKAG